MPELGEVEYYRKVWDVGLGQKILSVALHDQKRIFRGLDTQQLTRKLTGAKLLHSEARGKQMIFHFSNNAWLGIHLGMTGHLMTKKAPYSPEKHDHLVLNQKNQVLIFRDPRMFGRVRFDLSKTVPKWWSTLPPSLLSKDFTLKAMSAFLKRRGRAPIKAVILMQQAFPGVGNWIADEILWQAKIHPKTLAGKLSDQNHKALFKTIRQIATQIMKTVGKDFSDPPKTWFFHYRWKKKGNCPRCHTILQHATIGGRTTCWCPKCQ